jgi:HK97 family phage major capsid protein
MSIKRADEIRARQLVIRSDLDTLEQVEEPTEDEHTRTDALLQEWDELLEELAPLAEREDRVAKVRENSRQEGNREAAQAPDFVPSNKRDPFEDLESVRTGVAAPSDVRARAISAIEKYAERSDHWALDAEAAQNATRMVEKTGKAFGTAVARQMLVTGSPEYLAAFESYLVDPGGFSQRAAMSLTPANGGYLVPFTLDPTIILTNAGSANPYRQVATVKTTTTNDWNGVTSAGVSAEWTAEGIEAADASPTVGTLKITPQKADAYLFGSFEVLSDSDFGQQLPELLADAKDRIEETAFAVGTGSGQPKGIVPAATTLAAAAGTAATGPGAADAYALQAALPARFRSPRSNNVWIANLTTINRLRNVPSFTGATTSIVNDSGPVPMLLGKPLLESTSVVGDLRQRQQGAGLRRHAAVLHRRPRRHVRRLRPDRARREPPADRSGCLVRLLADRRRPRCGHRRARSHPHHLIRRRIMATQEDKAAQAVQDREAEIAKTRESAKQDTSKVTSQEYALNPENIDGLRAAAGTPPQVVEVAAGVEVDKDLDSAAVRRASSGDLSEASDADLLTAAQAKAPQLTAEFVKQYGMVREDLEAIARGLVPPPPTVGPIHNVDLHLTPGGWQLTPVGVPPEDVGKNAIHNH